MAVFKMCDSVPSLRYSPVCNVLRQWKTSLIPTYRVYQLYDTNILVCIEYDMSTKLRLKNTDCM